MHILHFVLLLFPMLLVQLLQSGDVLFFFSFSLLWLSVWLTTEMLISNSFGWGRVWSEELYRPRSLLLALTDDTLPEYYFEWIVMNYSQF